MMSPADCQIQTNIMQVSTWFGHIAESDCKILGERGTP